MASRQSLLSLCQVVGMDSGRVERGIHLETFLDGMHAAHRLQPAGLALRFVMQLSQRTSSGLRNAVSESEESTLPE
jgi:hypothetical protein